MNRNGWMALLALAACTPDPPEWQPTPATPVPSCLPPGEPAGPCRPATGLSGDDGRPDIVDRIDAPPSRWHEPSVPIPFAFFEPTPCVESLPVRDLAEACKVETYSPAGVLTEYEVRLGDGVYRYQNGVLVEEVAFDGAGRVIRRTANGWTQTWAYREDGALIDRRWRRPGQTEWEVRTCDGRIDHVVTSVCGAPPRQHYYDPEGRLARIAQPDDPWGREDFVYDSSGRLRVQAVAFNTDFWDAAGRLIRRDFSNSADGTEVHQYGPDGLVRTYHSSQGLAHHSGLTEYRYDAGRLTLWWKIVDANLGMTFRSSTWLEAHRLTYSCSGGKVMEEIDHSADGAPDVTLLWAPQVDGTVHETRWSPAEGASLSRIFYFDCDSRPRP